ncbi:unnamed protein product [Aphanomyces euteiches]
MRGQICSFSIMGMDDLKEKADEFFEEKSNLELILRVIQWFAAVVAFLCSTAITGLGAGDFAFLTTYTVWVYTLLYVIFVLRQKKIELLPLHKLVIDGVLTVMLFASGIAVAASNAFSYCRAGSCGGAYACVIFLFVGTLVQGASVWITYTQEYRRRDSENIDSPPAPMLEG